MDRQTRGEMDAMQSQSINQSIKTNFYSTTCLRQIWGA